MIGIRASGALEPIADALAALDEVDYVVITAGSFDLLVEVVCVSDEELLSVLSSKIRTIDERRVHRDLHVPPAAQADLLVGGALTAGAAPGCPCGTRRPTTTGRLDPVCPATSAPTWWSSAPG